MNTDREHTIPTPDGDLLIRGELVYTEQLGTIGITLYKSSSGRLVALLNDNGQFRHHAGTEAAVMDWIETEAPPFAGMIKAKYSTRDKVIVNREPEPTKRGGYNFLPITINLGIGRTVKMQAAALGHARHEGRDVDLYRIENGKLLAVAKLEGKTLMTTGTPNEVRQWITETAGPAVLEKLRSLSGMKAIL